MSSLREVLLADATTVEEMLDRMAVEMVPCVAPETALVGILRRGAPLARLLADRLSRLVNKTPDVGELSLKRYSDELELLHERPHLDEETLDLDIAGRHLVLVDDVRYTGESLFRAACFLRAAGAVHLHVAVLCARGEPNMPVRTDFTGCRLDVGAGWIVDCHVPPYEDRLGIVLRERDRPAGSRTA